MALLRSETLLRVDVCPVVRLVFVVMVTLRVDVDVGSVVVVVVVIFVCVGDAWTRVWVVTCLSPSTIRVVELERVVLPDLRDVVVVVLFAVRLVVVTFPFAAAFAFVPVVVALVFVLVLVRVAVREADDDWVLLSWVLPVELALVPDVEVDVFVRVEMVRVELMSRVPVSWRALVARVPLYVVVRREENDWSGYWRP
jgi:hypothetical protein